MRVAFLIQSAPCSPYNHYTIAVRSRQRIEILNVCNRPDREIGVPLELYHRTIAEEALKGLRDFPPNPFLASTLKMLRIILHNRSAVGDLYRGITLANHRYSDTRGLEYLISDHQYGVADHLGVISERDIEFGMHTRC